MVHWCTRNWPSGRTGRVRLPGPARIPGDVLRAQARATSRIKCSAAAAGDGGAGRSPRPPQPCWTDSSASTTAGPVRPGPAHRAGPGRTAYPLAQTVSGALEAPRTISSAWETTSSGDMSSRLRCAGSGRTSVSSIPTSAIHLPASLFSQRCRGGCAVEVFQRGEHWFQIGQADDLRELA